MTSSFRFRRVLALLAGLIAPTLWLMPPSPAGALTGGEKFVYAVYEDFLFREPDSSELAWWNAYLSTNSRAGMVSAVLSGDEFESIWVVGASGYYVDGSLSQYGSVLANLNSSGDFVASEVALVAGATYFADHGNTNTGYVQAVYNDVLLREPTAGDLSYWVGRLNAGTSTRASLANYFIRTTEAASRRVAGTAGMTACPSIVLTDVSGISSGAYCLVLDRVADASGASYWTGQLSAADQLPSLWSSLAGSTEYYNSAQARF